jgi:hypothetical protein
MAHTVKLVDGKYEFDIDERGSIIAARRNGEPWPQGFTLNRFNNAFVASINRIVELETMLSKL